MPSFSPSSSNYGIGLPYNQTLADYNRSFYADPFSDYQQPYTAQQQLAGRPMFSDPMTQQSPVYSTNIADRALGYTPQNLADRRGPTTYTNEFNLGDDYLSRMIQERRQRALYGQTGTDTPTVNDTAFGNYFARDGQNRGPIQLGNRPTPEKEDTSLPTGRVNSIKSESPIFKSNAGGRTSYSDRNTYSSAPSKPILGGGFVQDMQDGDFYHGQTENLYKNPFGR